MSLAVERLTRDAEIDRVAPHWRELWRRVPNATPFQAPEWLLSWRLCFAPEPPILLAAYQDNRLAGVLPLYLRREAECRKLLPLGISLSDYLDALIDPSCRDGAEALLGAIAALEGWDECHLPDLPPDAALAAVRCPPGLRDTCGAGETCPVLPLPAAIDRLGEYAPRKTLRDWRQARTRAAAEGRLAIEVAGAPDVAPFLQDLFRLQEARWGESGVCADPLVRGFHLMAAPRLQELGVLRLYRLCLDDTPRAVYYGFHANGVAYAYLSGFDERLARLSFGTQIVGYAIEQAILEGAREFHFLRGREIYKYAWGAIDRRNINRTLWPKR